MASNNKNTVKAINRNVRSSSRKINNLLKNITHKTIPISVENFKEFYKNKDIKGYYSFFKKNYLDNN